MFDNKPQFMKKAKWFTIKITSTGKSYKIENDPFGCTLLKSGVIKLPPHYVILDIVPDIRSIGSSEKTVAIRYFDDAVQGFTLPDKTSFEVADIHVYVYKDGI